MRSIGRLKVVLMWCLLLLLIPSVAAAADGDDENAEEGIASYVGEELHGEQTASGEPFDMHDLTAAHPELPFGTRVRVQNLRNDREVVVRINDRGPFVEGRIIDVSYEAARRLGFVRSGLTRVRVTVLDS